MREKICVGQLFEVLKTAHGNPKLLIMDEPRSSLSSAEIRLLFDYTRDLKNNGCTIIYISHKLNEILETTDSVTVTRDSKHVVTCPTSEVAQNSLISLMANRNFDDVYPEIIPVPEDSPEVFRVESMNREGWITGEVQRKDFDYERILKLAFEMGTKSNEAV